METLTHFQEDVLGDVLQSIHLHSTLYCRAKMGAPWGFRVSGREIASFHIVTEGSCWLTVEDMEEPVLLTEGDLVILPHGHIHTMTDDPKSPVTKLEDLKPKQPVEQNGIFYSMGQGAVTTLVCGGLQLEDYSTNPLYSILPSFIQLRSKDEYSVPWLRAIVELVRVETSVNRVEAETVITRLSELLFIQAVRAYIRTIGDRNVGWLGALKDPQIGQALALIQRQPDESWTVGSLASRVSLSRSAFSAKFKQLVGESPMQYTTRVRLTKAAALLRTNSPTLLEVAMSVGYDSEVAFSKAFKRYFGMAPGAYRHGRR
jgi:AraC-like DNA-binding protein/mannose-6-phosphate isomerase-like protein (cupin superfamily)